MSFEQTIEATKGGFLHAKGTLLRALETTADDRLNWSPAPSARTPIQIAAHAAWAVRDIKETLDGRTFSVPSPAEAEPGFREFEAQFGTREQVAALLEENGAAYLQWLDALTPERLATTVEMPFGMGAVPMALALTFVTAHTRYHIAQIDYVQTIYGDRDWHMA